MKNVANKKPTNKQIVDAWSQIKNPRKVAEKLGTEVYLVLRALREENVDMKHTGKGVLKLAA